MNFASVAGRSVPIMFLLALTTLVPACREQATDLPSDGSQMSAPNLAAVAAPESDFSGKGSAVALARQAPPASAQPAGGRPQSSAPSMLIRNGDVSVQVDSLEAAMEAVRRLAASLGGYVGNVSINTGQYQVRTASIEMKVPANRFDEAMSGMQPLGKVQHSTATAQDVGEEFVDVTARVVNAKRMEARLVTLLATRTGKLEDVLAVERELARVREEIERYEGRIRYLSSHVATSTIVATVHEKAPIVANQPGRNPIGQAFVHMWRNFVLFVAWGIESLGVVIPVAAIALLLARGWQRWRRTRVATA